MRRFLFISYDAAIAAVIMAPIFWILDRNVFHNKKRSFLYYLFAIYLSGIYSAVGLPDIRYIRYNPHFNFTPFAYMFSDATSSFLNVLLFAPMGFFLPYLWKEFRVIWKTFLFGFSVSVFIEILQIFTLRATDINDLLTNSLGTLIGWIIAQIFLCICKTTPPEGQTRDIFKICCITVAVMFFLHPYFPAILQIIG